MATAAYDLEYVSGDDWWRLDLWVASDESVPTRARELLLLADGPDGVPCYVRAATPADMHNYPVDRPSGYVPHYRAGEMSRFFLELHQASLFVDAVQADLSGQAYAWTALNAASGVSSTVEYEGGDMATSTKSHGDFRLVELSDAAPSGFTDAAVFVVDEDDADEFAGVATWRDMLTLPSGRRASTLTVCLPSAALASAFLGVVSDELEALARERLAAEAAETFTP